MKETLPRDPVRFVLAPALRSPIPLRAAASGHGWGASGGPEVGKGFSFLLPWDLMTHPGGPGGSPLAGRALWWEGSWRCPSKLQGCGTERERIVETPGSRAP